MDWMDHWTRILLLFCATQRPTDRWIKYARQCIKPALDYYKEHLQADIMCTPLKVFKAARLFNPHYLKKVKPQNVALNTLSALPFVTDSILAGLKEEYPLYIAAVKRHFFRG